MPRVPQYEQSVQTQVANVATPKKQPAPFSGDPEARALAGLGAVVSQASGKLAEADIENQKADELQKVLEADTLNRQNISSLLYDQQKGLLNRRLGNASGITETFDAEMKKYSQEIQKMPDDYQRALTLKMLNERVSSLRETLARHEAGEIEKNIGNTIQANIDQTIRDSAGLIDPPSVVAAINKLAAVNGSWMKRQGRTPEEIFLANSELAGKVAETAIAPLLETDPLQAVKIFNSLKPNLPPEQANRLQKQIDGKAFEQTRQSAWNALNQHFYIGNGQYDLPRMEAAVYSMELPADKKDDLWHYMKGRANEAESGWKGNKAANELAFHNDAAAMFKQGLQSDEIKRSLIPKYGLYGSADQMDKERQIEKMFDQAPTDDTTYWNIWKGINLGTMTDKDVAANSAKLSGADARALTREYWGNVKDPKSGFKQAIENAEGIVGQKFFNKKNKDEFMAAIVRKLQAQAGTAGATSDQLVDVASEEAKKVVVNKWLAAGSLGFFGTREQYKIDNERERKASLIRGALANGSPIQPELSGLNSPAQPGTPEYEAIRILQKNGRSITPQTISIILPFLVAQ